jgi:CRP/FNR family transcriptional regulator, cyclic AMP receptor protein
MVTIDIFRREIDSAVRFSAGQVVFRQGDAADVMYGVVEGAVEVRVDDTVIDRVEPGGLLGEMALIDHAPRSATAIAATDCSLVPIGERRFLLMVQQTPFFAVSVMRVLAGRLRQRMAPPAAS